MSTSPTAMTIDYRERSWRERPGNRGRHLVRAATVTTIDASLPLYRPPLLTTSEGERQFALSASPARSARIATTDSTMRASRLLPPAGPSPATSF